MRPAKFIFSTIALATRQIAAEACDDPDAPIGWWTTPDEISDCLDAGADINSRDDLGQTILHRQAEMVSGSDVANVRYALDVGADPNVRDADGNTPLHIASSWWASSSIIELLLEAGASPDIANESGHTPLHQVALMGLGGFSASVSYLVQAGADPNVKDNNGETPLHMAPHLGRPAATLINALIENGANPNSRNNSGSTPLFDAASFDPFEQGEAVDALLNAGADPRARNIDGQTPLHLAASARIVESLVAAGADLQASDDDGRTPLHRIVGMPLFAIPSKLSVIETLVRAGADLNARANSAFHSSSGYTPLHEAVFDASIRSPDTIDLLVNLGAPLEARTESGLTALHLAATSPGEMADIVVAALLTAGANPNAEAGALGIPRLVSLMIEEVLGEVPLAMRPNMVIDAGGLTPLHMASAISEYPELVDSLLDAGADPNKTDTLGLTAWDYAQFNDYIRSSATFWRLNDARFNVDSANN